jgi:hypothetical protein
MTTSNLKIHTILDLLNHDILRKETLSIQGKKWVSETLMDIIVS